MIVICLATLQKMLEAAHESYRQTEERSLPPPQSTMLSNSSAIELDMNDPSTLEIYSRL
jgi:hypothetical protein